MLLMLGSRLEDPSPVRAPCWTVCAISSVLALAPLFTVPATISGDQSLAIRPTSPCKRSGQLSFGRSITLEVIEQGVQNGQTPRLQATWRSRRRSALKESQLQQAEIDQQAETRRDPGLNRAGTAQLLFR